MSKPNQTKLIPEEEKYLREIVMYWLVQAKFWLGYLVGTTENIYFKNSDVTYYWYFGGKGPKLVIEDNHKKRYKEAEKNKSLSNLWAFQIGEKNVFVFPYPNKVRIEGTLIVEDLVKKYFPGIECDNTFAICDIREYQYCWGISQKLSVCRIIDGKHVCSECQEELKRKARKVYSGYIYLIGNKEKKIYKIGKSRQPKERYKAIATKLPFPVEIIHVINGDNIEKAEKILHDRFSNKRTHGEWFELSEEDVQQITNLISYDGSIFLNSSSNKIDFG